jgi:hypothetical protein
VTRGFALLLPLNKIASIPGSLLAPLNIQAQSTINKRGKIIPKDRLTHDQSWKWQSETSVNSRVEKDELMPCYFGKAIKHLINWAVAAHRKYPNKRILATKLDIKAAYRQCHLNAATAIQTCTQISTKGLALMMLRLTFGGAPCPAEWGSIAESLCNLANKILLRDEWDLLSLSSPAQHLVPEKTHLTDDIPFGIRRELVVDVPVNPRGKIDLYIDDFIGLTVDIDSSDNAKRMDLAPLLAVSTTSREVSKLEPLPRDNMDAQNKLITETGLTEQKIILGWSFDFCGMAISLPENKFRAYSKAISEIINHGWTSKGELETTIGRWVHLGQIVPPVHHFLSRLRYLKQRAKNKHTIMVNEECNKDLKFLLTVLQKCQHGINLNAIAYPRPTHIYRSDSCPAGLGGYSHKGFAWRNYLQKNLKFQASNNLLEHLAAIITPWVDILTGRLKEGDCDLLMTDNTMLEGWLKKTNFIEDGKEPIQATISTGSCPPPCHKLPTRRNTRIQPTV